MKSRIALCSALFVALLVLIVLLKTVGVADTGLNGSEVGLASINFTFAEKIGFNEALYKITNILDIVMIGIGALFVGVGIYQWVKRKSFLKVDKEIFILAGLYVVTLAVYLFFELIPLNYRPLLIDGKLESSFPSSHTLSSIVFIFSGLIMSSILLKNKKANLILNIVGFVVAVAIIVLRIISGVHWITDIIGGLLFAALLVSGFELALFIYYNKQKKEEVSE